jgi:hypothetical protein
LPKKSGVGGMSSAAVSSSQIIAKNELWVKYLPYDISVDLVQFLCKSGHSWWVPVLAAIIPT